MSSTADHETIGARIRRLRLERGLPQTALAGYRVSAAYISRIEADERVPSVRALRVIAQALDVSAEYLETGETGGEPHARQQKVAELEIALRLGDELEAVSASLEDVLAEARRAGDEGCEARARVALGMAAAHRGSFDEAVALLEEAVEHPLVTPFDSADAYTTLANSLRAVRREDEAIALLERCLAEARARERVDPTAVIRFATHLSYALTSRGDMQTAYRIVDDAVTRYAKTADPYSRVRLYWSQARLEGLEGDYNLAHQHISRAIGLLEATEDAVHLGRAHMLCAMFLLLQHRTGDAAPHLDAAEALLTDNASVTDRAEVLVERARWAARAAQPELGTEAAREAIDLVGGSNPGLEGRARWALGEALAELGDDEDALAELVRAEQLLADDPRRMAQLLHSVAAVHERQGDVEAALGAYKRAAVLAQVQTVPVRGALDPSSS